jgi:hypothetical protein
MFIIIKYKLSILHLFISLYYFVLMIKIEAELNLILHLIKIEIRENCLQDHRYGYIIGFHISVFVDDTDDFIEDCFFIFFLKKVLITCHSI